MLSILVAVVVDIAILLGAGFILSETVPRMPNKVWRFVSLFVLCVPMIFVINFVDVRLVGYHKISWTAASICALLFAAFKTFWPPQPHTSNTP